MQEISLFTQEYSAENENQAVTLMTIHSAKGLEFPRVYLSGLEDGLFPLLRDLDENKLEEERRLFYVGMTRAKEELILTSSRDLGGKRPRKVSQFVIEALDLKKEEIVPEKVASLERIERFKHIQEKEGKYTAHEGLLTLSALQVDDYLTCPLKYKYIHYSKDLIIYLYVLKQHNLFEQELSNLHLL